MRPRTESTRCGDAAFPSLTEALARGSAFFAACGQLDAGKARDFHSAFDAAYPAAAPAPPPFTGFRSPVDHRARVVAELLARSKPPAAEVEATSAAKAVTSELAAAANDIGLPRFDSESEESEYEDDVDCEMVPEGDEVEAAIPTVPAAEEIEVEQAPERSPETDTTPSTGRAGQGSGAAGRSPCGDSDGRPPREIDLPEAAAEMPMESEAAPAADHAPQRTPRRLSTVSLAAVSSPGRSVGRESGGPSSPVCELTPGEENQGSGRAVGAPEADNVRESGDWMTGGRQTRSILRRRPDDSPQIAPVFPEVECAGEGLTGDPGLYSRPGGMLVFPYDSPASRRASIASRVSILEDVTLSAINEHNAGDSRSLVETIHTDALEKSPLNIATESAVVAADEDTPAAVTLSDDVQNEDGFDLMDDVGGEELDGGSDHDEEDANCDLAEGEESGITPLSFSYAAEKKIVHLQNLSASVTPKPMLSKAQPRDRTSLQPRKSLQRARKPHHSKRLLRDLDVARAKREIELESANGPPQVRRSSRTRMEPLEFWRGEHKTYERRKSRIMPTLAEIEFIALERKEAAIAAKAAKTKKASKAKTKKVAKLANTQRDENAENVPPTSENTANPSKAVKAKKATTSVTDGKKGNTRVIRRRKRVGVNG